MARDSNLDDPGFERTVTLRDAYRIMERFVSEYHARGDTPVSAFLFVYVTVSTEGRTTDPAAAGDFLAAARAILDAPEGNRAR
jgi:hypothetical protein